MALTATRTASSLLDMTLDESHSQALREAAKRVEAAKAAFETAKSDREHLIEDVALAGASYREIAAEAGLSYQRVHQLLTGDKEPPKIPFNANLLFHCPKCEAKPGVDCKDDKGKRRTYTHAERSYRTYNVLLEESEEPREDEPGPHTALFQAFESMTLGFRREGPIYLNPDDADAYVSTLREGSYVARWNTNRWERV